MARKPNRKEQSDKKREIVQEPVDNLLLDVNNPRFSTEAIGRTQDEILRVLWEEFAVEEVAMSIAANGYFQEEPLLVIPEDTIKRNGRYIVVEGNRRLAAVRLLRDHKLRQKIKATKLPEIDAEALKKLDTVPVSIYGSRKELWQYLGFRHINGPQPWDSFSKAKYVAFVHEEQGIDLDEIADSIGDRHTTVKRLYRGYKILQQAEAETRFKREDIVANRFYFSHLYTAADYPEFQQLLGIDSESSLKPNPVPQPKLPMLQELMIWLFGSKSEKRLPLVQTQNPDLNTLRMVISEPRGLEALMSRYSLQRSYEISIGDERRFRSALIKAKEELQIADGTLTTGYSGEDEPYILFQDILAIVRSIEERILSKREKRKKTMKSRRG